MDISLLQTWVPIGIGLINLCGLVWAILQSSAKSNADAIVKLSDALAALGDRLVGRIDGVEKRISTLEDDYRHLPDKESIHRLEVNMTAMAGDVKAMGSEMKNVREISVMTRDMLLKDTA
ncbi:DUF2730 family protein [Devosia sp. J2-20]|uniref:DUF2730 family protein n=1 Tax=Devosia sp. J2-20 TaxID=3026161 RepID=UPI00249C6AF2|nr:DUF2730 family protein [Devosia sp. J2-20]WDR00735.1 DUF2730 family protein [Devosia sp. J2-20]